MVSDGINHDEKYQTHSLLTFQVNFESILCHKLESRGCTCGDSDFGYDILRGEVVIEDWYWREIWS